MTDSPAIEAAAEAAAPAYDGPARVAVRFHSDDPSPVSLPGYLNPVPSIVSDGDVFAMEGALTFELDESERFEVLGDAADHEVAASPNADLTKAELAEKIREGVKNAGGVDLPPVDAEQLDRVLHDDLVGIADEIERANPQPPGAGDTDTEGLDR